MVTCMMTVWMPEFRIINNEKSANISAFKPFFVPRVVGKYFTLHCRSVLYHTARYMAILKPYRCTLLV